MKRVNFGHKGGFPLEQETLIHLQRAYADDMLEALMARWSFDPNKTYLIKEATATEDGWIITRVLREETNAQSGEPFPVTKSELLRLKFNGGVQNRIETIDIRTGASGELVYADGTKNRVYEEWIARYAATGDIDVSDDGPNGSFVRLPKVEDLLPRDGSKPMTGNLDLGPHQISKLDTNETFTAQVRSADFTLGFSSRRGQIYPDRPLGRALVDNGDALHLNYAQDWEKTYINGDVFLPNLKQSTGTTPLVIDPQGNVGVNPTGIGSGSFEVGMIMMWSGTTPPTGWVLCNGGTVDGVTIPDLRGRFVVGYNPSDSDYNVIGDAGGAKTVRLTTSQMPSHAHSGSTDDDGNHSHSVPNEVGGNVPNAGVHFRIENQNRQRQLGRAAGIHNHTFQTDPQGGNQPHENRPPYYTLAYIMYIGGATVQRDILETLFQTQPENGPQTLAVSDANITIPIELYVGTIGAGDNPDTTIYFFVQHRFENGNWEDVSSELNVTDGDVNPTVNFQNRAGANYFRTRISRWEPIGLSDIDNIFTNEIELNVTRLNSTPISVLRFSDGTTAPKVTVVQIGNSFTVSLDARASSDPDGGAITQYSFRKCFESEDWTTPITNTIGTIQYTIPPGRYGLHYFGVRVRDNEGAESAWTSFDNALRYRINRPIIVVDPVDISVSPSGIVIFEDFDLAGSKQVTINSNQSWRATPNNNSVLVSPNTGGSGQNQDVILVLVPNASSFQGTILFETTGSGDTDSVTLSWGALIENSDDPNFPQISGGGGGCFDLESDVTMANGRSKKLKNIKIGDKLRGYDFPNRIDANSDTYVAWSGMLKEATLAEVVVKDMIVKTVDSYVQLTMVDGTIFNVTKGHPLLASKDEVEVSWIKPSEMRSGLFLIDKNGKAQEIDSKKTINKKMEIGVLDVENIDNYMIQGFIVHNAEIIRNELTNAPIDIQK